MCMASEACDIANEKARKVSPLISSAAISYRPHQAGIYRQRLLYYRGIYAITLFSRVFSINFILFQYIESKAIMLVKKNRMHEAT